MNYRSLFSTAIALGALSVVSACSDPAADPSAFQSDDALQETQPVIDGAGQIEDLPPERTIDPENPDTVGTDMQETMPPPASPANPAAEDSIEQIPDETNAPIDEVVDDATEPVDSETE